MGKKTPFGQLQCLCYVHNTARALASGYRTRVELPAPPLPWILTFGGWLSAPCNFVSLPLVPGLVTVRYQVQPLRPLNSPSLFLPVFLSFLSPPRLLLFLSFFLSYLLFFSSFSSLHSFCYPPHSCFVVECFDLDVASLPNVTGIRPLSLHPPRSRITNNSRLASLSPSPSFGRSFLTSIYIYTPTNHARSFANGELPLRFPLSTRFIVVVVDYSPWPNRLARRLLSPPLPPLLRLRCR